MKRRDFLGFFLVGGLVSMLLAKLGIRRSAQLKEARYWRKA